MERELCVSLIWETADDCRTGVLIEIGVDCLDGPSVVKSSDIVS